MKLCTVCGVATSHAGSRCLATPGWTGRTPTPSFPAYRAVEPSLLHELDLAFFDDRFEVASPTEQRILEAMAREAGAVRLPRLRQHLPEQAGMDLLVRRLVDRGLIYRAGRGAYDFALPLFRDYIRRRAKLTELTRSVGSEPRPALAHSNSSGR
jgi:hypothetical protein